MNWYVDLAILLPAIALGLATQGWVRHVVGEADGIPSAHGLPALTVAQRLLWSAGIRDVTIQEAAGLELDDHYDGRAKTIRLSDAGAGTVASLAIAAHEVGHAVQHAEGALSFRLRAVFTPVAAIASIGWLMLVFIGVFFGLVGLVHLAVILFASVAAFHLATLPVELGASSRAMRMLRGNALVTDEEERIVRRVLTAAALTYVAVALISIAQLFELMFWGED